MQSPLITCSCNSFSQIQAWVISHIWSRCSYSLIPVSPCCLFSLTFGHLWLTSPHFSLDLSNFMGGRAGQSKENKDRATQCIGTPHPHPRHPSLSVLSRSDPHFFSRYVLSPPFATSSECYPRSPYIRGSPIGRNAIPDKRFPGKHFLLLPNGHKRRSDQGGAL